MKIFELLVKKKKNKPKTLHQKNIGYYADIILFTPYEDADL